MPTKDGMLSEFDHEVATTRKLLERVPEDKTGLEWKPHAKSMSFGGISTHIANIPTWAVWIFDHPFFDLEGRPHVEEQHSRAAILKQFDDSTRAARKALEKSDAEYAGMWTLKRGGQEMFS